jgi:hypothetical protein
MLLLFGVAIIARSLAQNQCSEGGSVNVTSSNVQNLFIVTCDSTGKNLNLNFSFFKSKKILRYLIYRWVHRIFLAHIFFFQFCLFYNAVEVIWLFKKEGIFYVGDLTNQ